MSATRSILALALVCLAAPATFAQQRPAAPAAPVAAPAAAAMRSAPISNIAYEVTFDSATASSRSLRVAMRFDAAAGGGPVLLSLPA
jgi:hypothetical protein